MGDKKQYCSQLQEEFQQRNTEIRLEARPRTFPISRVLTTRILLGKGIIQGAQALDCLYLGTMFDRNSGHDACNDHSVAIAARVMRSLQSQIPSDYEAPEDSIALLHRSRGWQIVTDYFRFCFKRNQSKQAGATSNHLMRRESIYPQEINSLLTTMNAAREFQPYPLRIRSYSQP